MTFLRVERGEGEMLKEFTKTRLKQSIDIPRHFSRILLKRGMHGPLALVTLAKRSPSVLVTLPSMSCIVLTSSY